MDGLRRTLMISANELRLTFRDRGSLIWIFVMPLVFASFFGFAMRSGGGGGDPRVSLHVVDLDGGAAARELASILDGEGFAVTVHDTMPSEDKIYRTLVLPTGLTENLFAGTRDTLHLVRNEKANPEATMAAQVRIHKAVVRTLGALAELHQAGETVSAEAFTAKLGRSDLVKLDVSYAREKRGVPSGFEQSVPGMVVMFILYASLMYGGIFMVLDRQSGRLRRLATSPASTTHIFFGKIFGLVALAILQTLVMVVVSRFAFGLDWGSLPALAVLVLCYIFSVAALGVVLGSLARTPEQAQGIGLLAAMIAAPLGGCWWPMEIVPPAARWAGHIFPTAWAMDGMHHIVAFGHGISHIVVPAAVLLLFGALFFTLGAFLFRRVLTA
ncbi:MAG: ABC transporter permease subunit [Candidatus Eisenbacteria bacterium]|nr:ABC transporter permease subunit [Candidatus Eisenbacteria bacterium]